MTVGERSCSRSCAAFFYSLTVTITAQFALGILTCSLSLQTQLSSATTLESQRLPE